MYKFKSRYKFKPSWGILISPEKNNVSTEEAELEVAREHVEDIKIPEETRKFLKAYEYDIKARKNKDVWIIGGTCERVIVQIIPPKDKNAQQLFLRFYHAAKKDLKEKGRITEKT